MEFCCSLSMNEISKKNRVKILGMVIAVIFLICSARDLSALSYIAVDIKSEAYYRNQPERGAQSEGKSFDSIKAEGRLKKAAAGLALQRISLTDSMREAGNVGSNSSGNTGAEVLSLKRNGDWADNLSVWNEVAIDNTVIDWQIPDQNPIGSPGVGQSSGDMGGQPPTENIIPNPPTNNQTANVSGEEAIPDSPKDAIVTTPPAGDSVTVPPQESNSPDTPGMSGNDMITDTPGEGGGSDLPADDEAADRPSGGNATDVVKVSGFQINADGMIYDVVYEDGLVDSDGCITLPAEGCTGILKGTFAGLDAVICEILIPSNITYIENGVLADLPDLSWIEIEEDNLNYGCVDGVLFDSTRSTIVAFPAGRIGTYNVPDYVTCFADYAFTNVNVQKLDMRACGLMESGYNAFGDTGGNGLIVSAPKAYIEQYQEIFGDTGVIVE